MAGAFRLTVPSATDRPATDREGTDREGVDAAADAVVRELFFTTAGRSDPYSHYAWLRAHAPTHPVGFADAWVVSRYDTAQSVLRDPRLGKAPANFNDLLAEPGAEVRPMPAIMREGALVFMNPPEHTRLRSLVGKAFTPRRVEQLRAVTTARAEGLLDDLLRAAPASAGTVEIDVMDTFAFEVPVQVISDLVGVPPDDRAAFRQWVRAGAVGLEPGAADHEWDDAQRAAKDLAVYFHGLIRARRKNPADDLLSDLIAARDGADRLSKTELIVTTILLFGAGFETTMNLIGNAMLTLARNPDELERLARDPDLVGTAVDEVLRYESTAQIAGRLALEEVEIDGHHIPAGAWVIALLGSANRDPDAFPDPDRFDVGRQPNFHLSFSAGAHHCIGAALARMELGVVLDLLARRFSGIELVDPNPQWRPGLVVRGPERLPTRCTLRTPA